MGSAVGRGAAPAAHSPKRCPAMHGVGDTVGFAVCDRTGCANLGSHQKHVSVCLPGASIPTAVTAAGLPDTDQLSSLHTQVWERPFKAGCLQDTSFTDLIFLLFLIPTLPESLRLALYMSQALSVPPQPAKPDGATLHPVTEAPQGLSG